MLPELTPEILFWAFVFAALAFTGMVIYAKLGSRLLVDLNKEVVGLRSELKSARAELAVAENGRKLLISRIDRLIMRRDDLLACLNAAETDAEKVACIMRLMGAEGTDGSVGA